jgi:transcriptional regulator with XRE-family HTH domain
MDIDIGARIRALRTERGLSQEEVARRTGIGLRSYGDLERGRTRDPHYSTLRGIARALGVPVEELLEEPTPLAAGKAEAPAPGPPTSADPDVKGPDPNVWGRDEERPKWVPPREGGRDIRLTINDVLGGEDPAKVTITITAAQAIDVLERADIAETAVAEALRELMQAAA